LARRHPDVHRVGVRRHLHHLLSRDGVHVQSTF
jgi:predicted ArsR family transcriptional regulator